MYQANKIVRALKEELYNSLQKEYEDILKSFKIPKEEASVFTAYSSSTSLAGMETWLNAFHERIYFQDILSELLSIAEEDQQEFYQDVMETLLSDFGREDFRFIHWERTKVDRESLQAVLQEFIQNCKEKLIHLNADLHLSSETRLPSTYRKSKKGAKKSGLDVSLTEKSLSQKKIEQLKQAENILENSYKEGYELYRILSDKLIAVQSEELVSYSHFDEPGISYLNLPDRDLIETIDDLMHENGHHHLNLILKKKKLFKKETKNEQIFYSPWRRELRSLYGIYHAAFTFSYASELFKHLSLYALEHAESELELERCVYRFAEERKMIAYSLEDILSEKGKTYLTKEGIKLAEKIREIYTAQEESFEKLKKYLRKTQYEKELKELDAVLKQMRKEYRLNQA
ncbi:MAG: hypothetical protein H7A25_07965 [Leptospiraceae bacterium]|nr:hypothetical protein [Leptospiraceae bacterium]